MRIGGWLAGVMIRAPMALALTTLPALAQSPDEDQRALRAALVAYGCVFSDDTADLILAASGLTEERAGEAMFALGAEADLTGTVRRDEARDALVFTFEGCPK